MTVRKSSRIGRVGWFVLMLIGVVLIAVLYSVKTRALQAKAQVRKMERTLAQEQDSVHMLIAEIAHLENPERLRALADEHLNLQPVEAERTLSLAHAVESLPKKAMPEPNTDEGGAQ